MPIFELFAVAVAFVPLISLVVAEFVVELIDLVIIVSFVVVGVDAVPFDFVFVERCEVDNQIKIVEEDESVGGTIVSASERDLQIHVSLKKKRCQANKPEKIESVTLYKILYKAKLL